MPTENWFPPRCVVFAAALVYWAGVWIQARRVRRRIGKSPNLKPQGMKEMVLWAGWILVVTAWLVQPFLAGSHSGTVLLRFAPALLHPGWAIAGTLLTLAGYAGTLWCYASMGDTWRIGIDTSEKTTLVTRGPYRFIRHPIYLFQVVMLAGAAALLPTLLSVAILMVHLLCVLVKATDEESYLKQVHGEAYRQYVAATGMLFPKITRSGTPQG